MNKKYDNLLSKIFVYASIVIFTLIALLFFIKNNIFLMLLFFSIVIIISLKENIKKFPLILFITSLLIRLILIFIINFPPVADYETMLNAAQMFAKGDYSFSEWEYFSTWGYQTGFVIYQGLVLMIFKNEIAIKILNAIYSALLVLLIYNVGKKISSERSARMASLLYMVFPLPMILNIILNNHNLSTLLMYIGILFIIKNEKNIKDYAIAAILISIGNIIRPEGIIVVFSLILFEIFKLKKDKILDVGKKCIVFLVIYLSIGSIASFAIQKTGVNEAGLENNDPLWKFVLGFNNETCGYYSSDDEKYQGNEKIEKELIKERIFSDPIKTGELLVCKIDRFWLLSDVATKNEDYISKKIKILNFEIEYSTLEKLAIDFNTYLYIFTFIMCIIGVIFNRKKIINSNSLYFVILMTVTFFVFLLIEIRPRYSYFIHISIFILSTYGYEYLLNKLKTIKLNFNKNSSK